MKPKQLTSERKVKLEQQTCMQSTMYDMCETHCFLPRWDFSKSITEQDQQHHDPLLPHGQVQAQAAHSTRASFVHH